MLSRAEGSGSTRLHFFNVQIRHSIAPSPLKERVGVKVKAFSIIKPKNGSWPSRNPSTAAEAAALRPALSFAEGANGLSPNG